MKATLTRRAGWIIAAFFLMVPLTGCFSLMSYQTADTIPKGGVDLGFGWSVTKLNKIEYTGENGQTESADTDKLGTIPNLLPDILLRFGLSDNIDMGMRLFFLGVHGDAKFRLVNTKAFSLALAPGVLYSRPLLIFSQYGLDLPLLFTFKLGEYTKIYGGIKGEVSGWTLELNTEDSKKSNLSTFAVGGLYRPHPWAHGKLQGKSQFVLPDLWLGVRFCLWRKRRPAGQEDRRAGTAHKSNGAEQSKPTQARGRARSQARSQTRGQAC
jgi:hypothetical protein